MVITMPCGILLSIIRGSILGTTLGMIIGIGSTAGTTLGIVLGIMTMAGAGAHGTMARITAIMVPLITRLLPSVEVAITPLIPVPRVMVG